MFRALESRRAVSAAGAAVGAVRGVPLRREELRGHYEQLADEVLAETGSSPVAGVRVLPFRMVESAINIRSDEGAAPGYAERLIPDAVLHLLGWSGDQQAVRSTAERLLERVAVS